MIFAKLELRLYLTLAIQISNTNKTAFVIFSLVIETIGSW